MNEESTTSMAFLSFGGIGLAITWGYRRCFFPQFLPVLKGLSIWVSNRLRATDGWLFMYSAE